MGEKNITPKNPAKANAAVASNVNEESRLSLRSMAKKFQNRRLSWRAR